MSIQCYREFLIKKRSLEDISKKLAFPKELQCPEVDNKGQKKMVEITDISSSESMNRVRKINSRNKESRETALLSQHRDVWIKAINSLNSQREKHEATLDKLYSTYLNPDGLLQDFGKDLKNYQNILEADFQNFKIRLTDPIWAFRNEMKIWLLGNKKCFPKPLIKKQFAKDEYYQLMQTSQFYMENLAQILFHLETQQKELEKELNERKLWNEEECSKDNYGQPLMTEGIPNAALNLFCPDINLRDLVLMEFYIIDIKYKERLRVLREKYADVVNIFGAHPNGSWNEDDHSMFQSIYDLYMNNKNLKDKKRLCFDKLKRQFPHKSKMDLVAHETLWTSNLFYNKRQTELTKEWERDKNELLCKAKLVFLEACMVQDLKTAKSFDAMKQRELCKELHENVLNWRYQKLLTMQLEEEIEGKKHKEAAEHRKRELEKELHFRVDQKAKINANRENLKKQDKEIQRKMQESLEIMQKYLAGQAEEDKKRVKMRSMLLLMKHNTRQRQKEIHLKQEELKQESLQGLKIQVDNNVYKYPNRVFKETKASLAKVTNGCTEDVNIQDTLFKVYSYMDETILADPRFILEKKLRDAGLLSSPYAKIVLKDIAPLRPPHSEQTSSIFHFDH